MSSSTAIIGAGIAGITVARRLQHSGDRVVLFDKGRAAGGRIATRRHDAWRFDHGAQFFTVRDGRFRSVVDALVADGAVAVWPGPFRTVQRGQAGPDPREGAVRYVGTPGMSALPRALCRDLDVRTGQRITKLQRRGDGWWLFVDDKSARSEAGPYQRVVLTLPPEQATQLLADSELEGTVATAARSLRDALQPCLCAMVAFEQPVAGAEGGHFVVDDQALSWAAHDGGKPGRGNTPTYVLHANAAWSAANLERDRDDWARELVAAFGRALAVNLPPTQHVAGHLWRYALAGAAKATAEHAYDAELGLALAGDSFAGGRVEGAFCSGSALAETLLAT